jgi:hypothetical protein
LAAAAFPQAPAVLPGRARRALRAQQVRQSQRAQQVPQSQQAQPAGQVQSIAPRLRG